MTKTGRPTKYTDVMIAKAGDYLDSWDSDDDVVIPSQEGLAVFLGVSLSCVEKWGQDENKQAFLRVLDAIQAKQRLLLVNKGLSGDFNSNIAKLILSKHGYSDKQDLNHTSEDGSMSPKPAITAVDAIEAAKQYQKIMGKDE